jgi:hypothetical protein
MSDVETAELLKSIPLFGGLGRRDRLTLAKTARLRRRESVLEQLCTRLRALANTVLE